jgi:hypothetical protein
LIKEEGASQGYESSSEESVEEENNLVGRDTDESMEEDENGAEGDYPAVRSPLCSIWKMVPLYLLLPPPPIL